MFPVPTDAIVLSLPKITGMRAVPCVSGSSLIFVYQVKETVTSISGEETVRETYCFVIGPIRQHQIVELALAISTIFLIRGVV